MQETFSGQQQQRSIHPRNNNLILLSWLCFSSVACFIIKDYITESHYFLISSESFNIYVRAHKKPLLHPGEADILKTPKAKSRTSLWELEAKKEQGQKHYVWFIKSNLFLFKDR